jgi:hypothetical protein
MNMVDRSMTRRAVLSALTALAAAAPSLALAAAPGTRFRDVKIDLRPLQAAGRDDFAAWVAPVLTPALHQYFAAYLAPGDRSAPTLVARIDEVIIGSYHSGGFGNPVSDAIDGIQGAGVVVAQGGRQVASYPLYSAVGADTYLNQPYQEDITRRRVETLARSFAQWLPGKMGL